MALIRPLYLARAVAERGRCDGVREFRLVRIDLSYLHFRELVWPRLARQDYKAPSTRHSGRKNGGKLGAYAMKRIAAGAHLPTFLSLRNAQTIEPITACTAVSSPSASTGYSFLHLSGVGRALRANSGEGSAQ